MLQSVRLFWRRISGGPREKQAMALLRIAVGLYFLYEGQHKLTDPQFEAQLLIQLKEWAATNPFPLYKAFLQQWVIPNLHQVANLVTDGQILIGISYVTGFLIPLSAGLAIFLNLNFLLAMQHTHPSALTLNLVFILISLVLFWGKAGTQYGLDKFLTFSLPASLPGKSGSSSAQPRKSTKPKASIRQTGNTKPDKFRRKQAPAPAARTENVKKFERPAQRPPAKPASAKVRKLEKILRQETNKQKKQEAPPPEKREKIQPAPAPTAEAQDIKVVKIFDHRTPDDDD